MKAYATEIGNTTYLVKEDEGIAINLSNNEVISYEQFMKMLKKKSNEFSNEWINLGVEARLDDYLDMDVITAYNADMDFQSNNSQGDIIRTNYDIIIGINKQNEPFIIRDMISKTNINRVEELPLLSDGKGTEGFITIKEGFDNSILWYAYQEGGIDLINEVTDKLGFDNLNDVYVHRTINNLIIKKSIQDDVIFWFEKIIYTDQTTTIRTRKSRF